VSTFFFSGGKGGGLIGNWECSSLKRGQLKRKRNACHSAVLVTKQNKTKKRSKFDEHLQLRSLGNFLACAFPHISGGKVENRNRKKIQLHPSKARKSSLNLQFIWILQEKFTLKFLNCTIRRRRQARLRRTSFLGGVLIEYNFKNRERGDLEKYQLKLQTHACHMFHQFAEKERDVILLPTIMPGCYQLSLAENETQSCEDAMPLF